MSWFLNMRTFIKLIDGGCCSVKREDKWSRDPHPDHLSSKPDSPQHQHSETDGSLSPMFSPLYRFTAWISTPTSPLSFLSITPPKHVSTPSTSMVSSPPLPRYRCLVTSCPEYCSSLLLLSRPSESFPNPFCSPSPPSCSSVTTSQLISV